MPVPSFEPGLSLPASVVTVPVSRYENTGPVARVPFTVIVTFPVPAPTGTTATIVVDVAELTVAVLPLNATIWLDVVLLKPVPAMVTLVLNPPCVTLSPVIFNGTEAAGLGLLFFEQPFIKKAAGNKIDNKNRVWGCLIVLTRFFLTKVKKN